MNCDQVDEALGAYALDALPAEERREIEAHLAGCKLHEDALALRATAAVLAYAPEEREPPARLRASILAAIVPPETAATPEAPPASPAPISIATRRRRGIPGVSLLAAVIALLALGVLLSSFLFLNSADAPEELVRNVASGPAAGTTLRYLAVDEAATLDVAGLAALPQGRVYQIWTLRGDEVTGVGLFTVDASGRARTTFTAPLEEGDTVAVTEEPAGGSPAPTSQPLFAIQI